MGGRWCWVRPTGEAGVGGWVAGKPMGMPLPHPQALNRLPQAWVELQCTCPRSLAQDASCSASDV